MFENLALQMILSGALLMATLMLILWLIQLRTGNAGIVDVGWAGGLALLAGFYFVLGDGYLPRKLLILTMAGFWGVRLAWHLFERYLATPEDRRYQQLRQEWQPNLQLKFFLFYQFQGLLNVVLSIPFLVMCLNPDAPLSWLEWAGLALWLVAISGEALSDWQLRQFKADPSNEGQVCQIGLWNYSRHPNYFFDWLIWVSYFVVALSSPYGWLAAISPLLMLYFFLKVTGIPPTEEQALRSKGERYRQYQRTTSAFVPWFKKKGVLNHAG